METEKEFDSNVFKNEDNINALECDHKEYCNCKSMKRLFAALKYYSKLNIIQNDNDRELFGEFVNDVYYDLIDDFVHMNNHHSQELETIYKQIMNNESIFDPCEISKCIFTSRHHIHTSETNETKLNPTLNFYKRTMDSLHFYLFHCFDVGIRIAKTEQKENQTQDEQKIGENEYFDSEFARINKMIQQRQHITKSFDRFSAIKNTKFNIQADDDQNDTTFLDSLYEYLRNKNIPEIDIQQLNNYIKKEDYESECVEYDIDIIDSNSNIAINMKNKHCIQEIKDFIKTINMSATAFSVGQRFYYWDNFTDGIKRHEQNIQLDISGYDVKDLFIVAKYNTFKEEISNYKYFTFKQYLEEVTVKVNKYIIAKVVRNTRKADSTYHDERYGFAEGDVLSINHLVSVVLYCDYSELSTWFSKTFRKVKRFETIQDIKRRNSKCYWFSRYLREIVEVYGQCRYGDSDEESDKKVNKLSGPFYSGMSILLNMPAFMIRLCAPTSTSVQIEVASKFSGRNGIIIQLNNDVNVSCWLKGFNVSWISRYKEEDERLFFGGDNYMKIVSVRVKSTHNNYKQIIHSLTYLDMCVTGTDLRNANVSKNNILIIKTLFSNTVGKVTTATFDNYVLDTVNAFIQNKKQLTLSLSSLNDANSGFRDILMNKIDKSINKRGKNDFTNLFRTQLLLFFTHAKIITIRTSYSYSLSMIGLLSLIKSGSLNKVIVKANDTWSDNGKRNNWIYSLWRSDKEMLQKQYKTGNYTIHVKKVSGGLAIKQYWFLINKKN